MEARLRKLWGRFWMTFAGRSSSGRLACRIAGWAFPGYKGRHALARLGVAGYISPSALLSHSNLTLGERVFIGDGAILFSRGRETRVRIGDDVYVNRGCIIETGDGGSISIGNRTTIQPGCQFSCYKGSLIIGEDVQIAPKCAFYPYNHDVVADQLIKSQPLVTKGGILIEDDVWLGYGVVVLDGVKIGRGAVIGAGSVVTKELRARSIAAGVPARELGQRPCNIEYE